MRTQKRKGGYKNASPKRGKSPSKKPMTKSRQQKSTSANKRK